LLKQGLPHPHCHEAANQAALFKMPRNCFIAGDSTRFFL
jgi:hypothetical protein